MEYVNTNYHGTVEMQKLHHQAIRHLEARDMQKAAELRRYNVLLYGVKLPSVKRGGT